MRSAFRSIIISIGIWILNGIYFLMKLRPVRHRVTMISRQGDSETLDFAMLRKALMKADPDLEIRVMCRRLHRGVRGRLKYIPHMFTQMRSIAESEFVVVDSYCIAVSVLRHRRGLRVMQIWHASAAIKKFGYQTIGKKGGASRSLARTMKMHRNYDYVACCSRATAESFCEAFGCSRDQIVMLGLPRLDYIVSDQEGKRGRLVEAAPEIANGKKNLLYVPTFRKGRPVSCSGLAEAVDTDRWNILVHRHPLDSGRKTPAGQPGVIEVEAECVYDLFSVADAIVTDYSALAVEATLARRPVYYYTFDLEEYEENVGLNVHYSDEAVAKYQFGDAASLAAALDREYDYGALEDFSRKYIEVEPGHLAEKMAAFIIRAVMSEKQLQGRYTDNANICYLKKLFIWSRRDPRARCIGAPRGTH
jgi:CDP-glycerol glycerophosphotransferase (TagB/SpsB family)